MLVHLLKLNGWPHLGACRHWRGEVIAFQTDAERRFAPSMRQRVDLAALYVRAVQQIEPLQYGGSPGKLAPATCPVTMDELLTAPCSALEAAFRTEHHT